MGRSNTTRRLTRFGLARHGQRKTCCMQPKHHPEVIRMTPRGEHKPQFNIPVTAPSGCPGDPLIQMMEMVKTFKTPSGDFTALKGITACFYRGEFVSVVGKSGSGKSTLV